MIGDPLEHDPVELERSDGRVDHDEAGRRRRRIQRGRRIIAVASCVLVVFHPAPQKARCDGAQALLPA